MSYQFAPQTLFDATEMDWQITANAWRGSCLELFSRAERCVDDCIAALADLGMDPGPEGYHPFAGARMDALKKLLARPDFGEDGKPCAEALEKWARLMTQRALVASGTLSIDSNGVTLRYREHDGQSKPQERVESFTRLQMLTLLTRLGHDQLELHDRLDRIRSNAVAAFDG